MSSKLIRTAYLGTDSTNPNTDNNRRVNIHLNNGIPLVAIDDDIISSRKVKEIDYTGGLVGVSTTLNNVLVDKTDANRFIYVTQITSPITQDVSIIYYDAKYKDIIVIPETKYLGTGDVDDINANQVFDLKGYVVSGNMEFSDDIYTGSINPDVKMNLPATNSDISSKTMIANIYGISSTMGHRTIFREVTSGLSIGGERMMPTGIVDLGSITDLFTTEEYIPTYTMYQGSYNMFKVKYLGNKKPSKVYLLMDF